MKLLFERTEMTGPDRNSIPEEVLPRSVITRQEHSKSVASFPRVTSTTRRDEVTAQCITLADSGLDMINRQVTDVTDLATVDTSVSITLKNVTTMHEETIRQRSPDRKLTAGVTNRPSGVPPSKVGGRDHDAGRCVSRRCGPT